MIKQIAVWGGVNIYKLNALQTLFLTVISVFFTDAATATKLGTKIDTALVSCLSCADTPAILTTGESAPGEKKHFL